MRSRCSPGWLAVPIAIAIGGCPQFTSGTEPATHAPAADRPAQPAPGANAPVPGANAPVQMLSVRHILLQYVGSMRAPPTVTRTKEQAAALATQILAKVRRPGADFAAIANEYTEDQSGRGHGGALPPFNRASGFAPPFVDASYALGPNQISELVETPFGFHIIQRLP